MINDFSDEDPKMHDLILKYAPQFSSNPRDVKRFMNVFRFQYFILLARRTQRLSAPTDEQLAHWIVLSLKWPDLVRWLHSNPRYRLMQLENLGRYM